MDVNGQRHAPVSLHVSRDEKISDRNSNSAQFCITPYFSVDSKFTTKAVFFFNGATAPSGPGPPRFQGFAITFRDTTPLDEWSAQRRDLYLTTHSSHNRQDIHAPGGIQIRNPSKQAAADPCLRRRGHWDRNYFGSMMEAFMENCSDRH
jgi:hypothetical protein